MGKLYLGNREIGYYVWPSCYIEKSVVNGKLKKRRTVMNFAGVKSVDSYALAYGAYNTQITMSGVGCPNATDLKICDGDYSFYNCFGNTNITEIGLSNVEVVSGNNVFKMCFHSTKIISSGFDNLKEVSGTNAFDNAFQNCREVIDDSFPNLEIVSGEEAFRNAFYNCINLVSFSFPKLHTITGSNSFQGCFTGCRSIEHIYFPALTTSSFGTQKNVFTNLMYSTSNTKTHTIHFPSNLESTIQTLTGYPNFGGTNGYVVLAFDLPATS